MKIKSVDIPLYGSGAIFVITPDQKKAKKFLESRNVPTDRWPVRANALTFCRDGFHVYCYLPEIKTPNGIATACHELVHVAWQVLQDADVIVTSANHEAMTYLISYLAKGLFSNKK